MQFCADTRPKPHRVLGVDGRTLDEDQACEIGIVAEILEINPQDLREVRNQQVLVLRQDIIPFSKLSDVLNITAKEDQQKPIGLVMHIGKRSVSLGVDVVMGQVENVVKPFDPKAQQFTGFSGGTNLADGQVALLLDIPKLLNLEKLMEEAWSA